MRNRQESEAPNQSRLGVRICTGLATIAKMLGSSLSSGWLAKSVWNYFSGTPEDAPPNTGGTAARAVAATVTAIVTLGTRGPSMLGVFDQKKSLPQDDKKNPVPPPKPATPKTPLLSTKSLRSDIENGKEEKKEKKQEKKSTTPKQSPTSLVLSSSSHVVSNGSKENGATKIKETNINSIIIIYPTDDKTTLPKPACYGRPLFILVKITAYISAVFSTISGAYLGTVKTAIAFCESDHPEMTPAQCTQYITDNLTRQVLTQFFSWGIAAGSAWSYWTFNVDSIDKYASHFFLTDEQLKERKLLPEREKRYRRFKILQTETDEKFSHLSGKMKSFVYTYYLANVVGNGFFGWFATSHGLQSLSDLCLEPLLGIKLSKNFIQIMTGVSLTSLISTTAVTSLPTVRKFFVDMKRKQNVLSKETLETIKTEEEEKEKKGESIVICNNENRILACLVFNQQIQKIRACSLRSVKKDNPIIIYSTDNNFEKIKERLFPLPPRIVTVLYRTWIFWSILDTIDTGLGTFNSVVTRASSDFGVNTYSTDSSSIGSNIAAVVLGLCNAMYYLSFSVKPALDDLLELYTPKSQNISHLFTTQTRVSINATNGEIKVDPASPEKKYAMQSEKTSSPITSKGARPDFFEWEYFSNEEKKEKNNDEKEKEQEAEDNRSDVLGRDTGIR